MERRNSFLKSVLLFFSNINYTVKVIKTKWKIIYLFIIYNFILIHFGRVIYRHIYDNLNSLDHAFFVIFTRRIINMSCFIADIIVMIFYNNRVKEIFNNIHCYDKLSKFKNKKNYTHYFLAVKLFTVLYYFILVCITYFFDKITILTGLFRVVFNSTFAIGILKFCEIMSVVRGRFDHLNRLIISPGILQRKKTFFFIYFKNSIINFR